MPSASFLGGARTSAASAQHPLAQLPQRSHVPATASSSSRNALPGFDASISPERFNWDERGLEASSSHAVRSQHLADAIPAHGLSGVATTRADHPQDQGIGLPVDSRAAVSSQVLAESSARLRVSVDSLSSSGHGSTPYPRPSMASSGAESRATRAALDPDGLSAQCHAQLLHFCQHGDPDERALAAAAIDAVNRGGLQWVAHGSDASVIQYGAPSANIGGVKGKLLVRFSEEPAGLMLQGIGIKPADRHRAALGFKVSAAHAFQSEMLSRRQGLAGSSGMQPPAPADEGENPDTRDAIEASPRDAHYSHRNPTARAGAGRSSLPAGAPPVAPARVRTIDDVMAHQSKELNANTLRARRAELDNFDGWLAREHGRNFGEFWKLSQDERSKLIGEFSSDHNGRNLLPVMTLAKERELGIVKAAPELVRPVKTLGEALDRVKGLPSKNLTGSLNMFNGWLFEKHQMTFDQFARLNRMERRLLVDECGRMKDCGALRTALKHAGLPVTG